MERDPTTGYEIVAWGDCPVCGRKDVALMRQPGRLICADLHACFAAWKEAKGGTRVVTGGD